MEGNNLNQPVPPDKTNEERDPSSPDTVTTNESANSSVISLIDASPEAIVKYIKSLTDRADLLYILENTRAVLEVYEEPESEDEKGGDIHSKDSNQISPHQDDSKRRKINDKPTASATQPNPNNSLLPPQVNIDGSNYIYTNPLPGSSGISNTNNSQSATAISGAQISSNKANNKNNKPKQSNKSNSQRDPTKPPDIVLRPRQNWVAVRDSLVANNIKIKSARFTDNGVKISTHF